MFFLKLFKKKTLSIFFSKILCFTPLPTHPEATLYTIDVETFETKLKICAINKNVDLPRKNVKAVIFRFTKAEQKESSKMAELLEEYYSKYKVPFFCCSWDSIYLSAALMAIVEEFGAGKIDDDMDFIFCENEYLQYFKIELLENKYNITWASVLPIHKEIQLTLTLMGPLSNTFIHCPSASTETSFNKMDDNLITFGLEKALTEPSNKSSPKLIEQSIIDCLSPKNVTVINKDIQSYLKKSIVLKALHLLEEKSFKYNIENNGFKNYAIIPRKELKKIKPQNFDKFLIKILVSDIVPVKKTFVHYKKMEQLMLAGPNHMDFSLCTKKFDAGATLHLSVDKHFLFDYYIKNDNAFTKKAAFICLKNDLISVDLVRKGRLEKNVLHQIPAAISFFGGNIQIGEDAIELFEDYNAYIISDLIKIMMVENFEDLLIEPDWGFLVTKNDNNEIFLEFETFRGRRKATPAFLFAFILKWIIKNVANNFGKMPDTLVIVSKELNDTLKKQLMIAFENTKLEISDFQIQNHKLIEIKE